MMRKLRHTGSVIRLSFALVIALGCSSPAKPPIEGPPAAKPIAGDPSCPLLVPGTSISADETAWVFVTTGDVAEVRTRGNALATMHNDRNGEAGSMGLTIRTQAKAVASDIEGGVKVTFEPQDPATSAALGDELKMHAQHLGGASSCEMHH